MRWTAAGAGLLLLVAGWVAVPSSAEAQSLPSVFYGKGLRAGSTVTASIGSAPCGSSAVNASGEWTILIRPDQCGAAPGRAVSFAVDGAPREVTPPAIWQSGGTPPATAIPNGYVLQPPGSAPQGATAPGSVPAGTSGPAGATGASAPGAAVAPPAPGGRPQGQGAQGGSGADPGTAQGASGASEAATRGGQWWRWAAVAVVVLAGVAYGARRWRAARGGR